MNLKLPLKTESVDAWNGVYLFDNNDIQIGRIYNRETAEELVSSVNSCGAMRGALENMVNQYIKYTPQFKGYHEKMWEVMNARSALSSAPVDQQKERMVSILKRLAALPDTPSPMLIKGRIENLIEEAAALLKEMEANHG
jgi:hypothetical protein